MMKAESFAYWLQGFAELTPGQTPSPEQWQMIVEHLAEVFDKVTPPMKMGSNIADPSFGVWAGGGVTNAHLINGLNTAYAGLHPSAGIATTSLLRTEESARAGDTALTTHVGSAQTGGITALVC